MKSIFLVGLTLLATYAEAREPIATSTKFSFYSDYGANLNDALIATGVARNSGREELFSNGEEQICFEALAPSLRAGWNQAVDYYAEIISPHDFNDRQQYLIRLSLAEIDNDDARAVDFLSLAASFRGAASPAYKACRWPRQDALNGRWINDLESQLVKHEQKTATRLSQLYQQSWPAARIDVDVVSTVSWAGANSLFADNSAGHILISSSVPGHEALETVFHEASHRFMLRPSPLQDALTEAANQVGVAVPDGLWHVVLFYTTGEAVRMVLESAGENDYEPMIFRIYSRSSWGDYREAMDDVWPSYMDGSSSSFEAALELIKQINRQ